MADVHLGPGDYRDRAVMHRATRTIGTVTNAAPRADKHWLLTVRLGGAGTTFWLSEHVDLVPDARVAPSGLVVFAGGGPQPADIKPYVLPALRGDGGQAQPRWM